MYSTAIFWEIRLPQSLRQAKSTSKRSLLSFLSKRSCFKTPKMKSDDNLYLAYMQNFMFKVLSNISEIASLVPATDILSRTVQHHMISGCG